MQAIVAAHGYRTGQHARGEVRDLLGELERPRTAARRGRGHPGAANWKRRGAVPGRQADGESSIAVRLAVAAVPAERARHRAGPHGCCAAGRVAASLTRVTDAEIETERV